VPRGLRAVCVARTTLNALDSSPTYSFPSCPAALSAATASKHTHPCFVVAAAVRFPRCRAPPLTTSARHYLSSFLASACDPHISMVRASPNRRKRTCHREHDSNLLLDARDGADARRKTRRRCGPERQLHDAAAKGLATETNLLRTVRRLRRHGTQATRQLLPMQPSTPFKSVLPVATQSSMRLWLDFKHALGSETIISGNNTAFRKEALVEA
jgi:hypothetical protein